MTKETPILDIASLVPGEREIQISRPGSQEKLPIWVTLMSSDDARLRQHQRKLMDQQAHRQQRGKILSSEEKEKAIIELIARTITGWRWEVHYKGEIPEFSHRKAVEILSDENIPWFFAQINEAAGDTERFFQT